MKSYKYSLILILTLLFLNGIIFYNKLETIKENNFLLEKYNVNLSNNEKLIKCSDGNYQKVTEETLMICNKTLNKEYKYFLKEKEIFISELCY